MKGVSSKQKEGQTAAPFTRHSHAGRKLLVTLLHVLSAAEFFYVERSRKCLTNA